MPEKNEDIKQPGAGRLLFDGSSQLISIRFIVAISLALPVLVAFIVFQMPRQQLILDFGTIAAGRLFQLGLIVFSGIFFYIMLWFNGKYVLTIVLQHDDFILITTYRLWQPDKIFSIHKDLFAQPLVFNKGKTHFPFVPIVEAPYYRIRVNGRKMILDAKGLFPEGKEAVLALIGV